MTPYRQELEKYRDIDEDKILQELSPEELAQLDAELAEMDPENVLLPAGLRQRDQTQKSPTGPLDREALLQHLERQALEAEERHDLVPFTGEKKGKPFVPKEVAPVLPREEQVTLEPELEEALANATDAEMCDIAAILGMYTLMSNKQYYDAICSGNICNTEGINSGGRDAAAEPESAEPQPGVQLHHQRRDAASAGGPRGLSLAQGAPGGQPVPAPRGQCGDGHGGHPGALLGEVTMTVVTMTVVTMTVVTMTMMTMTMMTMTVTVAMSPVQCQRLGDSVEMAMAATLERCWGR
ncbi:tropomodulin-4 isoform 5-T7 [Sylvia borin]